jgi:DNA-binding transcriptional MerR regulator
MAIQSYRGPQVCKIVGITYRQLDYWARTGLIMPSIRGASGSGSQREYSYSDLVALKTIKSLLDTGISLQRVREAVAYLQGTLSERLSEVTLVSDGKNIYACHNDREVIDLLGRGQGVFAIALDPVVRDLEASLAHLADRRRDEPEPEPQIERARPQLAHSVRPPLTGASGTEAPR